MSQPKWRVPSRPLGHDTSGKSLNSDWSCDLESEGHQ